MRPGSAGARWVALAIALAVQSACGGRVAVPEVPPSGASSGSFGAMGDAAFRTLEHAFFNAGDGKWNMCVPDVGCRSTNADWGADSLTYALYVRWLTTQDARLLALFLALAETAPSHGSCSLGCSGWSDVPMWDSIASSEEHLVSGRSGSLARARESFDFVDRSNAFALGACPAIDYQQPGGGQNRLKTLETDSNYIKAALLLHRATGDPGYLTKAVAKYAAARRYFLDPEVPLYTVYVIDTGASCTQVPRRFFASVNGNMIWAGDVLALATHDGSYRGQALATARAVDTLLADPAGVYENLQAENDVGEPLVEAMLLLATAEGQSFARDWLLRNAAAAMSDVTPRGSFGRFFGGPPPLAPTTAWQANGGLTLAFAAAFLAADETPSPPDVWSHASFVPADIATAPATLKFSGSAVALIGSIGEHCCEAGHARVLVDGVETFDQTGIWQNKSSSGKTLPHSVLFAWRWNTSGVHTIQIEPGIPNPKEGGSFIHVVGYDLVP